MPTAASTESSTRESAKRAQKKTGADELTRGLEWVRDLLAGILPAHGHMDSLKAAREATAGLLQLRGVELSDAGGGRYLRIITPRTPVGAKKVAPEIYAVAARLVELMRREGMEADYDVTFNSLVEIAALGDKGRAAE